MTLKFKELELADLPRIGEIFSRDPQRLCCFSVQSLFAWKVIHKYAWAELGPETVVFSFQPLEETERHFFQPVGAFTPAAQAALTGHFEPLSYPARIYNTDEVFIGKNPDFMRHFTQRKEEGLNNYIYAAEDLAALQGNRYARKRTMIATARRLYDWVAEPVTSRNYPECSEIIQAWREGRDDEDDFRDVEMVAAHNAVMHFPELSYQGILLRVGGKPAAFSLFASLSPEMAVINFMRADGRYKGLSEAVFCETAKAIRAAGFNRINLEEDWGNPGLRKFKQSYRPIELLASNILTYKTTLKPAA